MKRAIIPFLLACLITAGAAFALWYFWAPPITYSEMEALQDKGEAAAAEIPRLLACLHFRNEDIRLQATMTLGKIGPKAVQPVREKLQDRDPRVRFYAAWALGWIGPPAAEATNDLLPLLKDDDDEVRYKTAYALGRIGSKSDAVITGLIDALGDSETVSQTAEEALTKIGPAAGKKLYELVGSSSGQRRQRITNVLVKLGPPPRDALPTLIELTGDPSEAVRLNAMTLLGQLGEPAVPTFKELLKKPYNSHHMIHAISHLGPAARPLLPELAAIITDPDKGDHLDASWLATDLLGIFKKCGPDGARPLADRLKALKPANDRRNIAAESIVTTLGEMGTDALPALPVLIELLGSWPSLQPHLLEALGDIGPAAREAIPVVESLVQDQRSGEAARIALRRLGVIEAKKDEEPNKK